MPVALRACVPNVWEQIIVGLWLVEEEKEGLLKEE